LEKGIRVGFGYDIQKTLKGLVLMEEGIRWFVWDSELSAG
jgi:hypothetical protein